MLAGAALSFNKPILRIVRKPTHYRHQLVKALIEVNRLLIKLFIECSHVVFGSCRTHTVYYTRV